MVRLSGESPSLITTSQHYDVMTSHHHDIMPSQPTGSQQRDATAPPAGPGQLAVQPVGQGDPTQGVQGGVPHTQHRQLALVDVDQLLREDRGDGGYGAGQMGGMESVV